VLLLRDAAPARASIRGRSIPLVAEEMKTLAARYDAVFNFADDDFGPLERIEALVSELGRRSLKAAFSLELRAGD
jgi:hypothetical protein